MPLQSPAAVKRLLLFPVTLMLVLMLAPSTTTVAQSDDKAYCAELSTLYRRYVQNAQGRKVDVEALTALDDCQKGHAAAAIPVLEKKLQQSGFSLPKEFKP